MENQVIYIKKKVCKKRENLYFLYRFLTSRFFSLCIY